MNRTPRTPTTTTVALANQKGGVAKTTNTINLAGAAASLGYKVLVIDADSQGHLTDQLGFADEFISESPSLYDVFTNPVEAPIDELIVEHPEFDLIPSNMDMFRVNQELVASAIKPRTRLAGYVDRLIESTDYDFIFVDAPPSLDLINDNVLLATQNVLVPCEAESTSKIAFQHLRGQIESRERDYDIEITEIGAIVSNVDFPIDNEQKKMLNWYFGEERYEIADESYEFEEEFEEQFDEPFTTDPDYPIWMIRNRTPIKRSMSNHQSSLFGENAPECDMTDIYLEIIERLLDDTGTEQEQEVAHNG